MMNPKDLGPDNRSAAYNRMAPRWDIMNALLGGTETMRAAGEDRLPKHPEESDNSWRNRLARAALLNMTEITLDMLVGKPFTEPVQLDEEAAGDGTAFHEWAEDIDLQGNNIDVFARRWFRDGMAKGLSHLLVDMPRKAETAGPRTLADDAAQGIRPYFVHIPAESVIFMSGTMVGGREVLDHVRIAEAELIRDGWGERVVQRIRVLEPGKVQIWELTKVKNRKDQWKMVEEWATDLDYIPMVTFYTDREELGVAKPPLLDLAYMNVHHWQLDADLNNIISVACFPMLAMSGVDNTEAGGDGGLMRLGPNQILATRSEQGKFYYVEHTGAAITTGMNKLKHIEQQMSSYGAQFLKDQPGDVKATTRALDSAEALSQLQAITLSFKDALEMGLQIMADWVGADKAPSVEMSVDFGLNDPNEVGWAAIDAARQRRDISRATYLSEMQRRGWLSDDYDADADQELLELEAQDMIQGAEAEANAQLERDLQLKQAGQPEPAPGEEPPAE